MSFEFPRVTGCCFCFSLKTGALVIGYLSMVGAALGAAGVALVAVRIARYVTTQHQPPHAHLSDVDVARVALSLYLVCSFQMLTCIFYFVISLLLVIGVHTHNPKYMRYYYVAGMVNLLVSLVGVVVGFIFMGFIATVTQLMSCAMMFYFLLVIRSRYLDLLEQNKTGTYEMHLYRAQFAPLVT